METFFAAANIFDRYLAIYGHWKVNLKKIVHLATVSMLMAAKLEQP